MKIIFTGTHGTGKTTIIDMFKDKIPTITEVVRRLTKEGININEMGDEEGQARIFDEYVKLLFQDGDYVSDRGLTDVYSYSTYHYNQGKLTLDELAREGGYLEKLASRDDILWVYFPIEFPVIDDGVRSVNEEYREHIDNIIMCTLISYRIPFIVATGTVEERIKIIEEGIRDKFEIKYKKYKHKI
jgi:nicotinamide riboside kinase